MKDLMFYLFMRSVAEKELNISIVRLSTGDIRQIKINQKKLYKLIRLYYQNLTNDEEELNEHS